MGPGAPQGTTTVAAVLGAPVRHSMSPALCNAAFDAAGLDWVYVAFEVDESHAAAAVAAVRTLQLGGASVTMPLKAAVVDHVDRADDDVRALGAANCLWWDGDVLCASSTDGPGFVASLRDHDVSLAGRRVVVLGAGGAARAVVRASALEGAADVAVVNRTATRAEEAASLAGAAGRVAGIEAIADAEVVVNATSIGMDGTGGAGTSPLPSRALRDGQVVVDLVYHPLATPLLRDAAAVGATAIDGIGMLVHQAALAFEHWTGEPAPIDAMHAAARRAP